MDQVNSRRERLDYIKPDVTLDVSHRCPVDVAAVLSPKYTKGMYSTSNVKLSMSVEKIGNISEVPKNQDVQYLTFKQSEKEELILAGYSKINTVHEYQGKQCDTVYLVRLSPFVAETIMSIA